MEILALRHQLAVLERQRKRARLGAADRLLWVVLSRLWTQWRSALVIVKPETVIAWHRKGFRFYWRWKSRAGKCGRPRVSLETRELIRQMSKANPLWGAPRIHGELLKLGIEISQATVAKYMSRQGQPPSQSWRTFLKNHVQQIVAIDFLIVRTLNFRLLFVFVALSHERRHAIHFNVTEHPTAEWTARQIAEAFPWDSAPGAYAPVTVLVDERPDGVHLSYDRMASFLAPYGNHDALRVAEDLDKKVETLLRSAAV